MGSIVRLFRTMQGVADFEECFCIGTTGSGMAPKRILGLAEFLQELPGQRVHPESMFNPDERVGMVGPRPAFETPFSSSAVRALRDCGYAEVFRVERFRRYRVPLDQNIDSFLVPRFDRMTECVYPDYITAYESGAAPEPVQTVSVLERGTSAIESVNTRLGLGMHSGDLGYVHELFRSTLKRNPTDVELFQIAQLASDHSRHRRWGAKVIIDGAEMPSTLIGLVREPYRLNPGNSRIGFSDNASAIVIGEITWFVPARPGQPSRYVTVRVHADGTCTVETHNHPTTFCPYPGAATGIGGCYRDGFAVGRGGLILFSSAGFSTQDLCIPGYILPWENPEAALIAGAAQALQIMREAPQGTWDYGNRSGIPVLYGFTRTVQLELNGQRWGYGKTLMLAGNVGQMHDAHVKKQPAERGMKIVQIGGPAYRIGFGGGTASSQGGGELSRDVAYDSVQRGDAMMGLVTRAVIEACVAQGERNPIASIHDQGAAGPANVNTELVELAGGRIDIRKIRLGDNTLSVLVIWGAEYQERYGILIWDDRLDEFLGICEREACPVEVLGEVTGDGRIVVEDSSDNTTPVDLPIKEVLSGLPQWVIRDTTPLSLGAPLVLPEGLTVQQAAERVLRLPVVGSKGFHVHRVDRSVGGLVVQQQCCGPYQLPVGDCAVSSLGFFDTVGIASSIGEQPLKTMLNSPAGVRMAIAEALLNMAGVAVSQFPDIKMQGNVMWPGATDGDMVRLYHALDRGVRQFLPRLGIVEDGGKDSMSMRANDASGRTVKSPHTFVATLYAPVPDVRRAVTPDLKRKSGSTLLLIAPDLQQRRLGASALAQVYNQLGDECPDVEAGPLRAVFCAVQELARAGFAESWHDRSDGGLFVTLAEMAIAGGVGLDVTIPGDVDPIAFLFAEESGGVVEVPNEHLDRAVELLEGCGVGCQKVGVTTEYAEAIINQEGRLLFIMSLDELRRLWEQTSYHMNRLNIDTGCAEEERQDPYRWTAPQYAVGFEPRPTQPALLSAKDKPKVAVLRTTGTNGQREMAAFFYLAGFEAMDVAMSDLSSGRVSTLGEFCGVVFPGGFADSDVFGAGRAWALRFQRNARLHDLLAAFLDREDVFTLGVCNGCQASTALGLVPYGTLSPDRGSGPRFIRNTSGAFESRWSLLRIHASRAIMFRGMEGSILGIPSAHGEGRLWLPDPEVGAQLWRQKQVVASYVTPDGCPTEQYPHNPNGSPKGWTALCDESGRHVAMMPHPERLPQLHNWHYIPRKLREKLEASPWLYAAQNLYNWCCGM